MIKNWMINIIPYPLRSFKLDIAIHPFAWYFFQYKFRKNLTKIAKSSGQTIWWIKFCCFTISYSRLV